MTEETENLVLTMLREIRDDQLIMKQQIAELDRKVDLCVTRDEMNLRFDSVAEEMNTRFDQIADLMTVSVSSQADMIHRIEDLENA